MSKKEKVNWCIISTKIEKLANEDYKDFIRDSSITREGKKIWQLHKNFFRHTTWVRDYFLSLKNAIVVSRTMTVHGKSSIEITETSETEA